MITQVVQSNGIVIVDDSVLDVDARSVEVRNRRLESDENFAVKCTPGGCGESWLK